MTLGDVLDEVASYKRTVTVYAPRRSDRLAEYFETRNVVVEHEPLPDDGSGGFVTVTADGEFVGSVGKRALWDLVSPAVADLEPGPNEGLQVPLNLLADTTFVSFDRRQLLVTSREFEDRAYRRDRGTLRAGFQTLSNLATQQTAYRALAGETGLDVHAYGAPDCSPDVPGVTVHTEDAPEIRNHWFVVFDGGGDDQLACALLAEELSADPGSYRGFWTYDPGTVADLNAHLRETYG